MRKIVFLKYKILYFFINEREENEKENFWGFTKNRTCLLYTSIDALFWMVMAAIGAAITTFVGQNYGAHLYDRIQKGARTALTIALTMAVSLSVILCFGGSYITKLFSSDPAIVNQCQSLILDVYKRQTNNQCNCNWN